MPSSIIVTGGAGFIGSNFVLAWLEDPAGSVAPLVNVDCLTYAGNLKNLESVSTHPQYRFVRADICDQSRMKALLEEYRPRAIVHFAAESHVDRSILGPDAFVETNVRGTFVLLEAARAYWSRLPEPERAEFRFLHVSTDEVYGSLGPTIRRSARPRRIRRTVPIPRPRQLPIIWCEPISIPTGCRR